MTDGTSCRRAASPRAGERGFTFLEILIVMAVMAMLMGIGIGYMQNVGEASKTDQARAILRETIFACQQSSNGGTRAILDIRANPEDPEHKMLVGAAVASPVLTHNFERLDSTSRGYELEIDGTVELEKNGFLGSCASFGAGARLVFEPQSAFAMTEGMRLDVWLKPTGGSPSMTVVEGEGAYKVQLQRDPRTEGYDVVVTLQLQSAEEGRTASTAIPFRTKGAPIRTNADWFHLEVEFDGTDVSIRINGLEQRAIRKRMRGAPTTPTEGARLRRLAVPEGGAVRLVLGSGSSSYVGLMDTLVLGGVFRSSDLARRMDGLVLLTPSLPCRLVFRNGRLDPDVHDRDVVLRLQEVLDPEGPQVEFVVGLYGAVTERLDFGGSSR